MEIRSSSIVTITMIIAFYIFLPDIVNQPQFPEKIKQNIFEKYNLSNETTHTFLDWIENRKNSFVALASATSVGVLQNLPVSPIKIIKNVILSYDDFLFFFQIKVFYSKSAEYFVFRDHGRWPLVNEV